MAFYSPGSHPAKGNHSNSSRAESGRGAKRGEIVTRKAGAGEERLKNKLEPKSSTPGINKSNPHPKIKPAKGKSQGTLQVGSKLALSALLQSALQQGIPQGLRLPTAAPRSHKWMVVGQFSLMTYLPTTLEQSACLRAGKVDYTRSEAN